ncbi:hypothetical protein QJS10_CPA09g00112 [Acorus calamus]|uniref:Uncharacterized protein n=1 Tax=Acorus calamus TaxID=4465 RepID=A0AAV9E4E3_ACOCL|nr:hypothetical protein QJS10_CPA09g00112 [Acorus calamus]
MGEGFYRGVRAGHLDGGGCRRKVGRGPDLLDAGEGGGAVQLDYREVFVVLSEVLVIIRFAR